MKFFIWKYNPKVIQMQPSDNILVLAPRHQQKNYQECDVNNVVFFDNISFKSMDEFFQKQKASGIKIDDIITLDEQAMDWVGTLKEMFTTKNGLSNLLFKDKYFMRTTLMNTVKEPHFECINTENVNQINFKNGLVKPRRSDSARGISHFHNQIDFKKLSNQSGYFDAESFLAEEFVDYDTMFAVDGYTDLQGHEQFFANEYSSKISDYGKADFLAVHTSSLYNETNLSHIKRLFNLSKRVLKKIATPGEVIPFHFEWFYNQKKDEFIFGEVGKRFGGVQIPELINKSFGINVLKEYWQLLNGKANEINFQNQIVRPSQCSTSYIQMQKNHKVMTKTLAHLFKNQFFYKQYIPLNTPAKSASSVDDAFFLTQFTSQDVNESDQYCRQLNTAFQETTKPK
ncbi:biotin carboxylase [Fructilactobacillus fructivorans]|uniref:Carboxylate--amine ligase n=1 Tax=Fructilactobacillus fructivorans TaxID=1614 RepID=A0AAE6P2J9_9LACO|nr:biotin carboxylase [Fructilactobacillus fructivorans]KRK56897.1 biotin carboxylase [Fructilactobacillus fructivorans]KRN41239.1 biotin carboxylase [Fructilactobacillus fructivorans]QFX93247.1 carboxylate--amine ligase [Fructilactobacillus fructivorans]RDV65067.1 carboxylate--amine ligase [Fructilactobacillus fructivorans]